MMLIASLSVLWGQQSSETDAATGFAGEVKVIFSPDQQLVNGVQYIYRYQRCLGHPYFGENELLAGTLKLNGREFRDLHLKYDLVTQDLELEYSGNTGMSNRIIVVQDFVEEFKIGSYRFMKMAVEERPERYYQVVSTPQFTCYIHWLKRLVPVADNINYLNECTDADRIYVLEMDGRANGFRNRKGFLSLFPERERKEIRRMMNRFQFKLNSASAGELVRLFEETSRILTERGAG